MRTPPEDLTDAAVAATVARHWGVVCTTIKHAPVGFGSHHWELTGADGTRWFVTADRVADDDHRLAALSAALHTAYALRHRCGLVFVIAPTPGAGRRLLATVGDYAMALYPYQERIGDEVADDQQMLTMITQLHHVDPQLTGVLTEEDDLEIEDRPILEAVLGGQRRGHGPFADAFADLLDRHCGAIERSLAQHDQFSQVLRADRASWVITHGEPKLNNTMITAAGPVLIDWDTVRIGPAARDVWMLPSAQEYATGTGRSVPPDQLDHYRLTWDLKDLCSFGAWFAGDHERNADTELGWRGCRLICERLATAGGRR